MRKKAIQLPIAVLIIFTILCASFLHPVSASPEGGGYQYEIVASPEIAAIGGEVTLTLRLTDYTEQKAGIRGLQVDVYNADNMLQNSTSRSLIGDTSALADSVSYQPERDLVRLLYVKWSGTMDYSVSDLLEIKIPIDASLTEAGETTFPVRLLIQSTEDDGQYTYNTSVTIRYAPQEEIPDQPAASVQIEWGAMEFTYSKGTWNPETYTYQNAGWDDHGSGYIRLKNDGEMPVTAGLSYHTERTDITGIFQDENQQSIQELKLQVNDDRNIHLKLQGQPSDYLEENTVIGNVTVTIGGNGNE